MNPKTEEELREKYMELQMLSREMNQLNEQAQAMDQKIMEVALLKEDLDTLKSTNKGEKMLSPVSEGMFVRSKLEENDELIINVGSSVFVKKNIDEAKTMLDERVGELEDHKKNLVEELEKTGVKAQDLEKSLAGLIEQLNQ